MNKLEYFESGMERKPNLQYQVNVDWDLGETICDFWIAFDVTLSTASILNLVAISIDR